MVCDRIHSFKLFHLAIRNPMISLSLPPTPLLLTGLLWFPNPCLEVFRADFSVKQNSPTRDRKKVIREGSPFASIKFTSNFSIDKSIPYTCINDGSGIDKVALIFIPNEEASTIKHVGWDKVPEAFEMELVDTGLDGDAVKGDGVYSRKIENQPSYFYNIEVKTIDSEGNNEDFEWPDAFLLKITE
jgi:hypothetical protein